MGPIPFLSVYPEPFAFRLGAEVGEVVEIFPNDIGEKKAASLTTEAAVG